MGKKMTAIYLRSQKLDREKLEDACRKLVDRCSSLYYGTLELNV